MAKMTEFEEKLRGLINSQSMENGSNTPDFILAKYLRGCLQNFELAVVQRDSWYGLKHCKRKRDEPGQAVDAPPNIHLTEGLNRG